MVRNPPVTRNRHRHPVSPGNRAGSSDKTPPHKPPSNKAPAGKRSDVPASVPNPSQNIVRPLSVFLRWARLELHQRIIDSIGLSIDRSAVLIVETLHEHGPMRMSELAGKIRLDRSTISRQVTAVTKAGLVQKMPDPEDGRVSVLALTPLGQTVRHKVVTAWTSIAVGLIAEWPPEDQAELARLLTRLAHQMEGEEN